MRGAAVAAVLVFLASAGVGAQWLTYPTPGIPRLPDGKPNLNAPAPRTVDGKPDLSGIWRSDVPPRSPGNPDYFFDLAKDLPPAAVVMTPWARGIQAQREQRGHIDDPYGYCMPPGVPRSNVLAAPFKIVSTLAVTVMLFETTGAQTFRQVFSDGRPLPDDPQPTWLGYSVGRWDGESFVVETSGFKDGGWLDTEKGRPHSDALHVTERFRRTTFGRMEAVVTITDPKAYVRPWTVTLPFRLLPDTDILEMTCESHQRTMEHRPTNPPPPEPPSPRLPGEAR